MWIFFFGHNGSHMLHLGSLSRHVESSSWPGIEHGPPALGAWSLNHWTTKDVPMQISDSAGLGWGLKFCISIRISSRWYWGSCSADDPHSSFERQDAKPGVTIVFYSPDQVTVLPCPRLSHSTSAFAKRITRIKVVSFQNIRIFHNLDINHDQELTMSQVTKPHKALH